MNSEQSYYKKYLKYKAKYVALQNEMMGGGIFYRTLLYEDSDKEFLNYTNLEKLPVERDYVYNNKLLYDSVLGSLDCIKEGSGVTPEYLKSFFLGGGTHVYSKKIYTRDESILDVTKNITSIIMYDILEYNVPNTDKIAKYIFIYLICAKQGNGSILLTFIKTMSQELQLQIKLEPVKLQPAKIYNPKLVTYYKSQGFSDQDEKGIMTYTPTPKQPK